MIKQQYTLDKNKRLSFRVNETLYSWVATRAHDNGVSPCDYARSVLFQAMSAENTLARITQPAVAEIARKGSHENIKKHK